MRNVARQEKNPIAIAQSSRVRQLLRGRLRASRAQLIETRTEAPGEPLSLAEVTDTKDCAEREQRSQTVAAAAKRLAAEIAATLAALDRLEDGRYGVCVDCGGDVGHARLLAQPAAAHCLSCQISYERAGVPGAS